MTNDLVVLQFTQYRHLWHYDVGIYIDKLDKVENWCKHNSVDYEMGFADGITSKDRMSYCLPDRIKLSEIDAVALQLAMDI